MKACLRIALSPGGPVLRPALLSSQFCADHGRPRNRPALPPRPDWVAAGPVPASSSAKRRWGRKMDLRIALLALCAVAIGAGPAASQPAAFYKGRTVSFLIGYGPGTGYDVYARLLIRHMARHIPG